MTDTFFSIWRNCYLRPIIRNKVNENLLINIKNLEHLNANHQFLSLFSSLDKHDHNIFIQFYIKYKIDFTDFLKNPHNHLINGIRFERSLDLSTLFPQTSFDFSALPQNVHRMSCYVRDKSTAIGSLPESLTELNIHSFDRTIPHNCQFIDHVLDNLPSNIKSLNLPNSFKFRSRFRVPSSLENCFYKSTLEDLQWWTVEPNKVLEGTRIDIQSKEELDWIQKQGTWINQMSIYNIDSDFTPGLIPHHITELIIYTPEPVIHVGALPLQLQWFHCTHINLLAGMFPQNLEYIFLNSASPGLEKGVLPPSLECLDISKYNEPLQHGVFPPTLEILSFGTFNHPLQVGHLPAGLKELDLNSFNLLLEPFVLPPTLETLFLRNYQQPLQANSLPQSIEKLVLQSFKGSFDCLYPLDKLKYIKVHTLNQSITTLLPNLRQVEIVSFSIDSNTTLQDCQGLEKLVLESSGPSRIPLPPGFLPSTLTNLTIDGYDIDSVGIIPSSCIFLKTDIEDLNRDFIPFNCIIKSML